MTRYNPLAIALVADTGFAARHAALETHLPADQWPTLYLGAGLWREVLISIGADPDDDTNRTGTIMQLRAERDDTLPPYEIEVRP